ncbi:MAG: hypothetical protein SOX10_02430 [Duodenibacillus sp.]|nr:hypothetical protein [Sutterella sp.]MDY3273277.1 hypothetical protein [Duodenibacillus sp.]
MWRYLFHDDLVRHYNFVASVNLPYAPHFWEVVHDLHLGLLEKNLEKLCFGSQELSCYQYWAKMRKLDCADVFK